MDNSSNRILSTGLNGKVWINRYAPPVVLSSSYAKIITIFGTTRLGKSYIMNVIRNKLSSEGGRYYDSFRSEIGSNSVTEGMWCIEALRENDRFTSYLLCDTEGAFELGSNNEISAKLLAISATISSCLIINIERQITANELNFFNAFLRRANLKNSKNFSQLLFLVRDWPYPHQYPFGLEGGNRYLTSVSHTANLRSILTLFEITDCFLLPPIGIEQERNPTYSKNYTVAFNHIEECINGNVVRREFDYFCNCLVSYIIYDVRKRFHSYCFMPQLRGMIDLLNKNEEISIYDLQSANEQILRLKKRNEKELGVFNETDMQLGNNLMDLLRKAEEREGRLRNQLNTVNIENEQSKRKMESLAENIRKIKDEKEGVEKRIHVLERDYKDTNEYIQCIEENNNYLRNANEKFREKCDELIEIAQTSKAKPSFFKKIGNMIKGVAAGALRFVSSKPILPMLEFL